ncbi:hypothetical protein FS842_007949 [Serendipita sp. 407]|nr:hypothetical protein FS842_007949 [Serendipita sp. 407]
MTSSTSSSNGIGLTTSTTGVPSTECLYGPGPRQISEIIPGFLYISDISCASDAILAQEGFTHVISILSGPIPWLGPTANAPSRVLSVRCDDDPQEDVLQHVELTNRFIGDAWREGSTASHHHHHHHYAMPMMMTMRQKTKVLCHCLAGVSRSPTIVAAYLIHAFGMRTEDALTLLRERREVIEPNPGFVQQLMTYEKRVRMGLAPSSSSSSSSTPAAAAAAAVLSSSSTIMLQTPLTPGGPVSNPTTPGGSNAPPSVVTPTTCRLSVPRIRIPVARA